MTNFAMWEKSSISRRIKQRKFQLVYSEVFTPQYMKKSLKSFQTSIDKSSKEHRYKNELKKYIIKYVKDQNPPKRRTMTTELDDPDPSVGVRCTRTLARTRVNTIINGKRH